MCKEEKRKIEKLLIYCITKNEQFSRKKIDLMFTYYGATDNILIGVFNDLEMLVQFNIKLKSGDLEKQIDEIIQKLEEFTC